MRQLSIPRALLAVVYLLLCAMGVASVVSGRAHVLSVLILVGVVITLLALIRKLGFWAQIVGLVIGTLYTTIGIFATGIGLWYRSSEWLPMLVMGPPLAVLGLSTIVALRSDMRNRSVEA